MPRVYLVFSVGAAPQYFGPFETADDAMLAHRTMGHATQYQCTCGSVPVDAFPEQFTPQSRDLFFALWDQDWQQNLEQLQGEIDAAMRDRRRFPNRPLQLHGVMKRRKAALPRLRKIAERMFASL